MSWGSRYQRLRALAAPNPDLARNPTLSSPTQCVGNALSAETGSGAMLTARCVVLTQPHTACLSPCLTLVDECAVELCECLSQ